MGVRRMIDCRRLSGPECSLVISGDEEEVLRAAVTHFSTVHGYSDLPELRRRLQQALEPEAAPQGRGRAALDFAGFPGESGALSLSGTEEEVMEAAAAHAVSVLGHVYTPRLIGALHDRLRKQRPAEAEAPSP
jgi:predicted small metal-binding protein